MHIGIITFRNMSGRRTSIAVEEKGGQAEICGARITYYMAVSFWKSSLISDNFILAWRVTDGRCHWHDSIIFINPSSFETSYDTFANCKQYTLYSRHIPHMGNPELTFGTPYDTSANC